MADKKPENEKLAEYEILGTKYSVTPVFNSNATEKENKGSMEDKIRRLILQDKQQSKGAKP